MRYAIYYAPTPGTAFHAAGSRWIGRDAFTGHRLEQPDVPGLGVVTGDPRRYGFHATLKPPFALRETVTPEALLRAVAALSAGRQSVEVRLAVDVIDGFVALVAREGREELSRLAADAVRELDGFRKPPSAEDMARRRMAKLSARQEQYLAAWGYPYVMEEFRFHMTLTERVPPAFVDRFRQAAEEHFAPVLAAPVSIDGLALFEETARGEPFIATRQFPFSRSSSEAAA